MAKPVLELICRRVRGTARPVGGRAGRWERRRVGLLVTAGGVIVVFGAGAGPAAATAAAPSNPGPSVLASPSARYAAQMDYDAATGNIVLFGGATRGGVDGDTWTFNGTTWTQLSPSTSPAAR